MAGGLSVGRVREQLIYDQRVWIGAMGKLTGDGAYR